MCWNNIAKFRLPHRTKKFHFTTRNHAMQENKAYLSQMKADINRNNPCFRQNIQCHFWRIWSVPSTLYGFLVWQGLRYLFRIASTVNKVQGFDFFCMNQKLQSCFGFQSKRNILWFKYSLTINSSELIIIIHLCICFKLAQINQFEVSQANKPKCMNFVTQSEPIQSI